MSRNLRLFAASVAAASLATALFFHRAAFTSDIFIGRDVLRGVYPLKLYWAQRVGSGELPQWFPYDGLGQPFIPMMVSAVFHPTNLLFLAFPLGLAQKLCTLACYPVAFLGMFWWLRRLGLQGQSAAVAGILFACNGYAVGISNNVPYLMAAATVPWVFWGADGFLTRPSPWRALVPASALALVLAAGEPETFAVACGLTLALPLTRPQWRTGRAFAAAAAVVGLGSLLSAPLLVPVSQMLGDITAGARPLNVALTWSVHPLQWAEVALGALFGGTPDSLESAAISQRLLGLEKNTPWVESLHLGVPALILAGLALAHHRRQLTARALAVLALVLALMMLGKFAGLYGVAFDLFPFWRPFRYPVKLFPFFALVIAVGAAYGVNAISGDAAPRRTAAKAFVASGLGCAVIAATELAFHWASASAGRSVGAGGGERVGAALIAAATQSAVVCFVLGGVWLAVRSTALRSTLAPLAIALHLFVVNEPHYQVGTPGLLETTPRFVEKIRSLEGPPQLGRPRVVDVIDSQQLLERAELSWSERVALFALHSLTSDTQQLWGLEGANNIMPATSARYALLCKQKDLWLWRFAGLFNTGYVSIPARRLKALGGDLGEVILDEPLLGLSLLSKRDARPRAYLARSRCVADPAAALAALSGEAAVPADQAIVECPPDQQSSAAALALGEARITSYQPERVELSARVLAPSVLVLNDAWYRGWVATVDGLEAPIFPANYAVRALPLTPGDHRVVFQYRTPGLKAGFALAVAALLGALGAGLVLHRRRGSLAP